MARKRRTFYPKRQRRPADGGSSVDPKVDIEAKRLAETFGPEQLQGLLVQAQEAYDNADRESLQDPSPQALRNYKSAERSLAATQRALEIVSASVS